MRCAHFLLAALIGRVPTTWKEQEESVEAALHAMDGEELLGLGLARVEGHWRPAGTREREQLRAATSLGQDGPGHLLGTLFKAPYPLLQDEVFWPCAISGPRRSWAPTWYAL